MFTTEHPLSGTRSVLYKARPILCEGWTFDRPDPLHITSMTYLTVAKSVARCALFCCWVALLVPGCATTAPVSAWRPAEIDVEGMRKLAVLDFSGENGAAVSAALTTRLWENQFYSLVDQAELSPVRVASAVGSENQVTPADYFDSARNRSIDGIIVGDVIEYRCDDHVLTNTDIHLGTDRAKNNRRGTERQGVDVGVSHNQTVHREATVSIAFRLVEVDTGNVRATRKTTHNFQGDFAAGSGQIPARGRGPRRTHNPVRGRVRHDAGASGSRTETDSRPVPSVPAWADAGQQGKRLCPKRTVGGSGRFLAAGSGRQIRPTMPRSTIWRSPMPPRVSSRRPRSWRFRR